MRILRKIWLDSILGTFFVFGLMAAFANLTFFKIFDVFDPIGDALGDFELTDIVYSQFRDAPVADERIVLVNLGELSRPDIALMLNIINEHKPAVVGFDTFFNFPKEDTLGDLMLAEALSNTNNLVMVTKLFVNPETDKFDSVHYSWPLFSQYGYPAFANLDTEAEDQDDLKFCRGFIPKANVNGDRQISLAMQMAKLYDSAAAEEFLMRKHNTELVNFRGNVMDFGATKFGTAFFALDWIDVFQENFVPEMIEGKIVLFCFLGKQLGDRTSLEDKFITPLNAKYAGRTLPDMFGGVIHANIISMVLSRDYIEYMTDTQGYIAGFFLCLFNVFLFTMVYKRLPKWYDGITKLFALFELLLLNYWIIIIFNDYNYKLEITIGMIAVALAGDALEVYHGVVKNSFTREGRRSLFKADKY